MSWWTWPSRWSRVSSRLGRGADGKENVRRDRRDRDTGALARGQVAERDVAEPGGDRKTIRKYVAPAVAAGIVPGGLAKSEGEWQDLVREWFAELSDARLRQVTWPAIGEHHDYIAGQLKAGVRMSTIHQQLRDEHGLAASVASFRRYVAANVPEEARRSQVTVWSPRQAEAGEQAQIDYGQLGRWLDRPGSSALSGRSSWC